MSVDQKDKIDAIGIEPDGKTLGMMITDHFDWDEKFEYDHLMMLQEKINLYVYFIESKQYSDIYPNNHFEKFCIDIHFKYELNENCKKFIEVANKKLSQLNIFIKVKHC